VATFASEEPLKTVPVVIETPLSEKLAAELVGTFLLFLAAVCSGADKSPLAPFAVAAILTGLIYAFAPISGAVFNPAVLVALVLRGKMALVEALQFAGAETVGAMLAGLAGRVLYGTSVAPMIAGNTAQLGSWGRALLSEILFTFTILTVVLHAASTKAQEENDVVFLAVGLTVFGCIVCASASGSAFNPAGGVGLWLAKGLTGSGFSAAHTALYVIGPSAGAALATLVFMKGTCPREP